MRSARLPTAIAGLPIPSRRELYVRPVAGTPSAAQRPMARGPVKLADVNAMSRAAFVAALGGIFEHSPWVAEHAYDARPFASLGALHDAMTRAVGSAPETMQLALIRAHPELAGKAAVRGELTAESAKEQAGAGLDGCTAEEFARLHALNAAYNAKFGFPFILAVKGYDRAVILREFARRVERDGNVELDEALAQIARIARLRLDALIDGG
jgi:2-oxo-4-hydroxy-4-carboxy-5-ureidoimidazoline decarboxylase